MLPEKGAKLMEIAKSYVGCHYINGSYGAIPGKGDGSPNRPGGLELINSHKRLDPTFSTKDKNQQNLAVSAAEMTVKTYCVCAGSWRTMEPVGRWTDPRVWDLNNYLDTLRSTPNTIDWMPYVGKYTPRRAFGPGQTGEVYWGQPCTGIRHFDCITFINYCLWKLTGTMRPYEILGWRDNPVMTMAKVFTLPNGSIKLEDGDILIRTSPHQHIAFVSKDGQVIQAADTDKGVIMSKMDAFKQSEWSHLARVPWS